MTCLITGTARLPSGVVLPGAIFTFKRSPHVVAAQSGAVVVPQNVTTTADAAGAVSFVLLPGNYSGLEASTGVRFSFAVPDVASIGFAECINAAEVPTAITFPAGQLTGTLLAAQEPAHTGDVTNTAGSLALTIAALAVTNAKMATMPARTIKANLTASSASPTDATVADARALLLVVDYATRPELVAFAAAALAAGTIVVGLTARAAGLTYRYIGSGTAISDMFGWVPEDDIFARHFKSAEDYDQATQAGTDDYAAITAAMAYATSERVHGVAGGVVWITFRSKISAPLVVPQGVCLRAVNPVSSTGSGATAASAFPITYNEGSGLVGSHTAGPIILLTNSDTRCIGLTLGATSARQAAAITSGALNRNCGGLIEPADTVGASLQRAYFEGCLVRDQPADGFYGAGNLFDVGVVQCHAHNVGGHGLALDCGELSGRANKAVPGEIIIDQFRANNTGGHILCIGPAVITVGVPYRVRIIGTEGFRAGNNPAILLKSAGYYILAEQLTMVGNASTGTSGYSGTAPTLTYGTWVAGRNCHFFNCRQIGWATMPVSIGVVSGIGSRDIRFIGGYASSTAANSTYFANVEGVVREVSLEGLSGDFTTAPLDALATEALGGSGSGYYVYEGKRVQWGIKYDNPTTHEWLINGGATALKIAATYLFSALPLRYGTAGAAPSGMNTNVIGVQGLSASDSTIGISRFSNDTGGTRIQGGKSRATTVNTMTGTLASGDDILSVEGFAADGTSAMIQVTSDRHEVDSYSAGNPLGRWLVETRGPTGALVEAIRANSSQVVLTAKQTSKSLQSYRFSIAADAVATIAITGTSVTGIMQVAGSVNAAGAAEVHFRCGASAFMTSRLSSGVAIGVGTTALTGTTGVAGQLNLAATVGGIMYIENRTGATRTYVVTMTSIDFASGEFA